MERETQTVAAAFLGWAAGVGGVIWLASALGPMRLAVIATFAVAAIGAIRVARHLWPTLRRLAQAVLS